MIRFLLHDVWHPLSGFGYQFWSGIGSGSPVFAVFGFWLRHHNCHRQGCWRIGHPDGSGRPVCRRHRPVRDDGTGMGVTTSDGEW